MTLIDYNRIKRVASMALVDARIYNVPVAIMPIAAAYGLNLKPYASLPGGVRRLCMNASDDSIMIGRKIFYNEDKPPGRVRFSLAHEIGHYLLGHTLSEPNPAQEAEANFFAKYLLAPPVVIHYLNVQNADDLSRRFALSGEFARNAFNYYIYRWNRGQKDFELLPEWDQAVFSRFFGEIFTAAAQRCRRCGERALALTSAGECECCIKDILMNDKL